MSVHRADPGDRRHLRKGHRRVEANGQVPSRSRDAESPSLLMEVRPPSARGKSMGQSGEVQQFTHKRFAPLPSIGTSVPSPITLSPSALPTHMSICGQSLEASRLSSPHPPLSPHPPSGTPHGRTMHAQRKHKFRAKTNHSTASPITLPSHPSPPHTLPSHPSPPHTLPPHPSPHHTLTSHPSLPHTLPSYPSPPHTLPAPHISLPPEPSADNPLSVLLCIKLPSGGRAQRRFLTSDRLSAVLLFSVQQECDSEVGGVSSEWELSTSEVPKRTLHDTSVTLEGSGLSVNSLLHLSERSGCGDGWLPKQVSV